MTDRAVPGRDTAARRYRERHIERGLPAPAGDKAAWRHVLVIPAYRESGDILEVLHRLSHTASDFLAILVANRPDSDPDRSANDRLRTAVAALPKVRGSVELHRLAGNSALLFCDTEASRGPLPTNEGVGLARKIGCDIAWHWIDRGAIATRWIHCTDADARLPDDYFVRIPATASAAAAATFPFTHRPGPDPLCDRATALYELRLHHFVLGLEHAGSPYAYHSLGSCLAVAADAYAQVRGFPRRAAGEDFYLLNKLAKVGGIQRLGGDCIALESRVSHRVPFGTGPAVARISGGDRSAAGFYHPQGFETLRAVLTVAGSRAGQSAADLQQGLQGAGLPSHLAAACSRVLDGMGWQAALDHCLRHSKSADHFARHFHQWFDGFRTLKFIHALRADCLPQQSLAELAELQPRLWPEGASQDQDQLLGAIRSRWGWTRQDPARW